METINSYWIDYYNVHNTRCPVEDIATAIASVTGPTYSEQTKETFVEFTQKQYAKAIDNIIMTRYGNYNIAVDFALGNSMFRPNNAFVHDWLLEREPYIRKCMEYIAAEYNPIENYTGVEHEETVFEGGQRVRSGSVTVGPATDASTIGAQTVTDNMAQQDITTLHTKVTTDTTADKTTTETQNAPFEGGYVDKDKTTVSGTGTGGKVIGKTEVYADNQNPDKVTYGAHTDTHGTTARSDSYTHGGHTDSSGSTENAYTDETTRDMTRHGNLGVMTAAQMIEYDRRAWEGFTWLRFLAKELANLIGYEVTEL